MEEELTPIRLRKTTVYITKRAERSYYIAYDIPWFDGSCISELKAELNDVNDFRGKKLIETRKLIISIKFRGKLPVITNIQVNEDPSILQLRIKEPYTNEIEEQFPKIYTIKFMG